MSEWEKVVRGVAMPPNADERLVWGPHRHGTQTASAFYNDRQHVFVVLVQDDDGRKLQSCILPWFTPSPRLDVSDLDGIIATAEELSEEMEDLV